MPWSPEVERRRRRVGRDPDRGRAIGGAHSGRHAKPRCGIDRDRERRLVTLGVLIRLRREVHLVGALARQRHADEATRLAQHEIDHRRSDLLRRADEIALVLAVLVIGNHDELARAQIGDCLLNRSNWHESPRQ